MAKKYSYQELKSIIFYFDQKKILPLMLESIKNEYGTKKQDCVINAVKSLLPKLRK